MGSMKAYQAGLLAGLISELRTLPNVMVIGDAMRRVPVMAFAVAGMRAEDVVAHLGKRGMCAFADSGHNGVFAALGVGEIGGAVRIGLAHYTNIVEVDQPGPKSPPDPLGPLTGSEEAPSRTAHRVHGPVRVASPLHRQHLPDDRRDAAPTRRAATAARRPRPRWPPSRPAASPAAPATRCEMTWPACPSANRC